MLLAPVLSVEEPVAPVVPAPVELGVVAPALPVAPTPVELGFEVSVLVLPVLEPTLPEAPDCCEAPVSPVAPGFAVPVFVPKLLGWLVELPDCWLELLPD